MSKHIRERALHITLKGTFRLTLKWYHVTIIVCIIIKALNNKVT